MEKQRQRLATAELVKLADWLRNNRTRLKGARPSYKDAASEASEFLGQEVSVAQLKRVGKEVDVVWMPRPRLSKEARINRMIEHYLGLCDSLDYPVDDDIRELAQ